MPIGSLNPVPFRIGGGPTNAQKAYGAMRRAVGKGGTAKRDDGIDGLWRRSRAKGLASAASASVRAAYQAWPQLATDALPYYERALGLPPAATATDVERRADVVREWTERAQCDLPALLVELQAIDARCSILEVPHDYSTVTEHGRAFAPHDPVGAPPFGPPGFSIAPNYSSDLRVVVLFAVGYTGKPTPADQVVVERIRQLLLDRLPSCMTYSIVTNTGFTLDQDPLDATGFGS